MKTVDLSSRLLQLGITQEHCISCRLPRQSEAVDLVESEDDIFERKQRMTSRTLDCWHEMKKAAAGDDIKLLLVSAYRSVDYQCSLIEAKLKAGQQIGQILKVNAIPGYSEHHTGRALDLTTLECKPLDEAFENTTAFSWLRVNASRFDFSLSYPKDNAAGINYEPWHWVCGASPCV